MTGSPFATDRDAAARLASLAATAGEAFTAAVLGRPSGDPSFLRPAEVDALVDGFGLRSAREAAILALPAAARFARPPISAYRVGAVGLTADGALVLGGNLEFPGASIHHTIHGEGFVTLRARALGLRLAELAIGEARPCAHCRQVLAEMAWADDVRIVDPLGHDLALADLYPWPFAPADLGAVGAGQGPAAEAPGVNGSGAVPADVATALRAAGAIAHAPYSREPAACVLECAGGRLVAGSALESVAFNPTIGPLQDALVALAAAGVGYDSIAAAWLAIVPDGRVDHVGPIRDLLAAVSPGVTPQVTYWA